MKILIVSWHTNIDDNSVANKCILEKLEYTYWSLWSKRYYSFDKIESFMRENME